MLNPKLALPLLTQADNVLKAETCWTKIVLRNSDGCCCLLGAMGFVEDDQNFVHPEKEAASNALGYLVPPIVNAVTAAALGNNLIDRAIEALNDENISEEKIFNERMYLAYSFNDDDKVTFELVKSVLRQGIEACHRDLSDQSIDVV